MTMYIFLFDVKTLIINVYIINFSMNAIDFLDVLLQILNQFKINLKIFFFLLIKFGQGYLANMNKF